MKLQILNSCDLSNGLEDLETELRLKMPQEELETAKNSPRRRRVLRGRRRSPFEPGKIKFVMDNTKLRLLFNREKKELDTKLARIVNLTLQ